MAPQTCQACPRPPHRVARVPVVGRRWGGRRLPAAPTRPGRATPSGRRAGHAYPRTPLPPPPRALRPPPAPSPPSCSASPARGRLLPPAPAPALPVRETAGGEAGREAGASGPLPRGRAAQAQTFPYVVAPRGQGGARGAAGDGGHARGLAATLALGPLPRAGTAASSGGRDQEGRPPALFVPRSVSVVPLEGSGHCLWAIPSLPEFPCVCGKVALGRDVQAETSQV